MSTGQTAQLKTLYLILMADFAAVNAEVTFSQAMPIELGSYQRIPGNSENAVKTQIWSAVSTYVLIAIVKKELQLNASLYTLLQILSVSIFEKTEVSSALQHDRNSIDNADNGNQLNLFNF